MQIPVQLLVGNAWLNHHIKILIMHLNDVIHFLHIDRDTAVQRGNVPLKGGPGSVRNHGNLMLRAELYDLADFFRRFGSHHSIGRNTGVKGFIFAKALTNRRRLGKTITKLRLKAGDDLGHCRCRSLDWGLICHGLFRVTTFQHHYIPLASDSRV